MIPPPKAHAKNYAPSAAGLWLPCPGYADVAPLYPNVSSAASSKGDLAHHLLEIGILFGIKPDTQDPDMDMNIRDVLDWVAETREHYSKFGSCTVYAEQQYDIPETGEFGTCDITFVMSDALHIADYKNGYVFTDALEQLMMYLLGAVAKFGKRPIYFITVIQPNYDHIDGPIRTRTITHDELIKFSMSVIEAVKTTNFNAGAHCKKYYCPHRGACKTFLYWAETEGVDAYHSIEINSIGDDQLAIALDHSDTLHGFRDELRKEAMRRIAQHDRCIPGYKLVKSRQQRDFAGDAGRDACYKALMELGYSKDDLYEKKRIGEFEERTLLGVAGVERMVKQKCKNFGRGKWKQVWEEHFQPHIRSFSGSLTLERAIDGRPAHTRGSEFGSISSAQVGQVI